MEQQNNKLFYLVCGLVILLLMIIFAWLVMGRNKVISPVPEEGIKVIFTTSKPNISPTPEQLSSPTASSTVKQK